VRRLVSVLFLVAAVGLSACGSEEEKAAEIVRPVKAVKVGDTSQLSERTFPGRAKAHQEVNLSFRVGGPLISRPVIVGDVVEEDQVIARIDPRDFEVDLRNVEGRLSQAKAELDAMRVARPEDIRRAEALVLRAKATRDKAQADYRRVMSIKEEDPGAISQASIDAATSARDQALAELSNADEQLVIAQSGARAEDIAAKEAEIRSLAASADSARDQLDYTNLKAPFAGTIVATFVENFEDVKAKQAIVRILDTSKIEMIVDIPENLISVAPYVKDVQVRFDAFPDVWVPAKISEIGTEASQTTRTYPVTVLMDQPEDIKILPGMAGEAKGQPEQGPPQIVGGMEIPISSVLPGDGDASYVWVVDEATMTVAQRQVTTGPLTDRGILILEGLEVGEWIATAGANTLREGQKVTFLQDQGA